MKYEDLKHNVIYYALSGNLSHYLLRHKDSKTSSYMCWTGKREDLSPSNFSTNGAFTFIHGDTFTEANDEEKQWFEACEKAGTFVPNPKKIKHIPIF